MMPDPESGFDPLFVNDFSYRDLFTHSDFLHNSLLRNLVWLFLAFAGSVYFGRFAVIKTIGVILAFPVTLFLIVYLTGAKINWVKIYADYSNGYGFPYALAPFSIPILLLFLPWIYFKLKEKEI